MAMPQEQVSFVRWKPPPPMRIEVRSQEDQRLLAAIVQTEDGRLDAEFKPEDLTEAALQLATALRACLRRPA